MQNDLIISSVSWSPDGKRLAFSAPGLEEWPDIFVADWDGHDITNITQSPIPEGFPAWSPDGNRIAYEACSEDGCRLISSNPDGTEYNQLLSLAEVKSPRVVAWSPNGRQIAFVDYNKTGALEQIYIANLDGSELVQLTDEPTTHLSPTFSSDGRWIAFVRYADPKSLDRSDIFLIHPDGTQEANLTMQTVREQLAVAWSPLGNWIAFSGIQDEKYDIYLIRSDGSHLVNITQSMSQDDIRPAWRLVSTP